MEYSFANYFTQAGCFRNFGIDLRCAKLSTSVVYSGAVKHRPQAKMIIFNKLLIWNKTKEKNIF